MTANPYLREAEEAAFALSGKPSAAMVASAPVEARSAPAPHAAAALALRVGRRAAMRPEDSATPLEACLEVLLGALGWVGDARHVVEALPHFDRIERVEILRAALARLGYQTEGFETRLGALTPDQTPCVFEFVDPDAIDAFRNPGVKSEGPNAFVAFGRLPDGRLETFDGASGLRRAIASPDARVRVVRALNHEIEASEAPAESGSWFWSAFRRFRKTTLAAMALTLAANVLALSTPLFSMAVYNNILVSGQIGTLVGAVLVVLGALLLENWIRKARTGLMATLAARLNAAIVREAFSRILTLPLAMTERASLSVQIGRIKQLEGVLSAFTSHLASAVLDLPFTLVFLIAIGLIAGPLIAMPMLLALVFAVLAVAFYPVARRHSLEASQSGMAAQAMLRETVSNLEAIQALKAEEAWLERLSAALRRSSRARRQAGAFEQMQHALAQLLTMIAGALTLLLGGLAVMDETLSIGGLIAVMMLVWKVLSPIQMAFLSINQVVTTRDAIRQVNLVMGMPTERKPGDLPSVLRRFQGRIEVSNVAFRYPQGADLVLKGVSFTVEPGQIVGITGAIGAGKSTLVKLLLGLYKPSAGAIYLDGLHLSQLDPAELRHAIGFAPSEPEFFYGSVAQNMRMAAPTATEAELLAALGAFGLTPDVAALPEGMETRLSGEALGRLTASERQQLSLARALAKRAPILLLDDPQASLSSDAEAALGRTLASLRGRVTGLIVSSRSAHLALCDKVAVLQDGRVAAFGPPDKVLVKPGG